MLKNKILLGVASLFIVLVFANANQQTRTEGDKIEWLTIEEAQTLNKENPRTIFIDVYTKWCGWCKKMDKATFQNAEIVDLVNGKYYAVKLDAESKAEIVFNGQKMTEQQLARSMRVSGYPTIVLMDENLKNIQPVAGYKNPSQFKKMLTQYDAKK